jgi:hypothetical protein
MEQRKIEIHGLMKNKPVAWRNKSSNRTDDAHAMNYICSIISNNNIKQITSENFYRIS